ncbi:uncharacterized protein LOC115454973 [Manduca sexta]|uniref:uncharacterized protein LOC115454973 n=1 Tax=Manduca sexta TaxID=7130 RepID=UPI00188F06F3|nr:uncharacterized protein LOC115454973 [Manduca sexta]
MLAFIFICNITFALCDTLTPNTNQNFLDYLYDGNYQDKFSHPQYDADVNTTIISSKPIENSTIDDEQAKLVRHELTKYALNLFKVVANRSFVASKLDLKRDLNYTEGNVNEFVIKWYLKEINMSRGDIFFTKGNSSEEVRGKELNNLIIDLLNKKLTGKTGKIPEDARSPIDETLRNLDKENYEERIRKIEEEKTNRERLRKIEEERLNRERIMNLQKENINKEIDKQKIDITKLNTTNWEYLMLKKIKENYKNKKYDDPYISLSDIDRQSNINQDRPTPNPGRQFHNPEHPGIPPNYPNPNEYPVPGRPGYSPGPDYPELPVHPATIYPPRNPEVLGAFPSPEEMGIQLMPGEPGYTGTAEIPGPTHGIRWTPPIPHFGPTGVTPRPLPGESPRPTRSLPPSVHGDPDRPFGSLLHQNPKPVTTTRDPFFDGLLQDMQSQKNGYLTTFFIKLFEYVATMKKQYARLLIVRLEPIVSRLHGQQQLIAFGEPLTTKLLHNTRLMNSAPADVVQSHAATAHYALTHRRTFLSAEINGIIDYADTLYNDMEGQNLLKTLKEVKLFPNISKTNVQLADEIFDETLLAPYRRMTGTHKIQVLFDSINNAIIRRFPGMRRIRKNNGVSTTLMVQSTLLNMYKRVPRKHENKIHKKNNHKKLWRSGNAYTWVIMWTSC